MVDFSEAGIAKTVKRAKEKGLVLNTVVADMFSYVPEEKFDVVVISHVLHQYDNEQAKSVFRLMQAVTEEVLM